MSEPAFTDHFQDDIVTRIGLDPLFADTVIIQERAATSSNEAQRATAGELKSESGKYGRFTIVMMPVRTPDEVIVEVCVRVIPKFIKEAGVDPHNLVWNQSDQVERLFQDWSNGVKTLKVRNIVPYSSKTGVIGYDLEVYWERITESAAAPELPVIWFTQDGVEIVCATPGATIRYTTDGSLPVPTSAAYSAPFEAEEGALIRAMAYASGQPGSGCARGRVPAAP